MTEHKRRRIGNMVLETCRDCEYHVNEIVMEFCEWPDFVIRDDRPLVRPVIFYQGGSKFPTFCPLEETD